jgi:hypothetical protein
MVSAAEVRSATAALSDHDRTLRFLPTALSISESIDELPTEL